MFAIGDFARLGRVSIRMLRHYDAIGLLRPARVDPATGYRSYTAAQLARLNRIVALKDLGFNLRQVAELLAEPVDPAALRSMLRLRQAELADRLTADRARLRGVEARIHALDAGAAPPARDVVIKTIPAIRIAELSAVAASYAPPDITPVIVPLFDELCRRLDAISVVPTGPGVAYYVPDSDGVAVHAGLPIDAAATDASAAAGLDPVVLPRIRAATLIHHGPMDDSDAAVQDLASWIGANGYRSGGLAREVTLECPPDASDWVTEFQEAILPAQ